MRVKILVIPLLYPDELTLNSFVIALQKWFFHRFNHTSCLLSHWDTYFINCFERLWVLLLHCYAKCVNVRLLRLLWSWKCEYHHIQEVLCTSCSGNSKSNLCRPTVEPHAVCWYGSYSRVVRASWSCILGFDSKPGLTMAERFHGHG